jgi:ribonuclease P protein component
MLKKARRVTGALAQDIIKKGTTKQALHFSLRVVPIGPLPSRFSFHVPKKIEKTAVRRNKIKRRGMAVVRNTINTVPSGYAGIFFAKAQAYDLPKEIYEEEIGALLKKLTQ